MRSTFYGSGGAAAQNDKTTTDRSNVTATFVVDQNMKASPMVSKSTKGSIPSEVIKNNGQQILGNTPVKAQHQQVPQPQNALKSKMISYHNH
jgi:hypothetical protein